LDNFLLLQVSILGFDVMFVFRDKEKRTMKIAVLTCVYPSVLRFLPEFFESLKTQSDLQFDLLIGNDGPPKFKYDIPLGSKVCEFSGTPAGIRKQSITWALELGYEGLIFADADDTFQSNRIFQLKKSLEVNARVVFHDLILYGKGINSEESMFGNRFSNGQKISEKDIRFCNVLGLSNTAVRTQGLVEIVEGISDDVTAFDWAFFARLFMTQKIQAEFNGETSTYYRQHSANIASPHKLNDDQIIFNVAVKKKHYLALSDLDKWYQDMAARFLDIELMLLQSTSFRDSYLEKIRLNVPPNPLWWEIARLPEEIGIEDYH